MIKKKLEKFTRKQLVSFGNYLLSEERNKTINPQVKGGVNHADIENWKVKQIEEI